MTTPKVSQVKDDPESPDMFGLDQVNIVDLDQLEHNFTSSVTFTLFLCSLVSVSDLELSGFYLLIVRSILYGLGLVAYIFSIRCI